MDFTRRIRRLKRSLRDKRRNYESEKREEVK